MPAVLQSVLFLISVYWPYMAVAGAIGLVTGWLSLSREAVSGGRT